MKSTLNAAIAIPTLNRYQHFKRCIESLANNSMAKYTDIYIGLDYPPEERFVAGWKKLAEYLDRGITGFANVYIMKHDHNLGSVNNILYLLGSIRQSHKTFIISEDDNEFSPNYLEYMNKMLDYYESDKQIVAVSGYNYPMQIDKNKNKVYFNDVYFAALGYGSWFDKFDCMSNCLTSEWLFTMYNNRSNMANLRKRAPNQYCNFVKGMLGYTTLIEKNKCVWKMDMTYGLYMFFEEKKMVFPLVSKVKNWGYDGTGENCETVNFDINKNVTHRNFDPRKQELDSELNFERIMPVSVNDNEILIEKVNEYFAIPIIELFRSIVAYYISRIVGIERIRKIFRNEEN